MLFVDKQFINRMSPYLRNFKWVGRDVVNFSCPICGDSKKNERKARGYIHAHDVEPDLMVYTCHNCAAPTVSLKNFIRDQFPHLLQEYILERFKSKDEDREVREEEDTDLKKMFSDKHIESVRSLSPDHPARKYLDERKIPLRGQMRLGWADDFKEEVYRLSGSSQIAERASRDGRILIPLKNRQGKLIGVQGRCLGKSSRLRYQTIMFGEHSKVFGLDKVDNFRPIFVFEGALDSLFCDNSLGMCGADISDVDGLVSGGEFIFVYDNEPRSEEIVRRMRSVLDTHHSLVLFDGVDTNYKDLNDMVLGEVVLPNDVYGFLLRRRIRGAAGKLKFNKWRRC